MNGKRCIKRILKERVKKNAVESIISLAEITCKNCIRLNKDPYRNHWCWDKGKIKRRTLEDEACWNYKEKEFC